MKRLLNTLFVTTEGAYLTREGETVLVRVESETRFKTPIHHLGGIVCFGRVSASPALMALCGQRGVLLSFMSEYGRFQARVQGPVSGNVLLRRAQYRMADSPDRSTEISRTIVSAKAFNARTVLRRAVRDRPESEHVRILEESAQKITEIVAALDGADLEGVRGREGEAARLYFSVFDHLITAQKDEFQFTQRTRRPPLDPINALLSFLYTLLVHDVTAGLEGVGLDPAVGFLHRDRPGRPSLALDLMEELRPILADRLALSLVNRRQIKGKQFTTTESGGVHMDDDSRKTLLVAYQKRKQEEIMHPFIGEKIKIGLLPHIQALLLARYIRGDLDGYPPFFWR